MRDAGGLALVPGGSTPGERARRAIDARSPDAAADLLIDFYRSRVPLVERGQHQAGQGVPRSTEQVYRGLMWQVASWAIVHGYGLDGLTTDAVRAMAAERLQAGRRASSVSSLCVVARMWCRALRWAGLDVEVPEAPRIVDPVRPWDRRPAPAWEPLCRAIAELHRKALDGRDRHDLRLASAVSLLALSGLRAGEVIAARWGDLTLTDSGGSLRIAKAKSGHGRTVPLTAESAEILRATRLVGQLPSDPIIADVRPGHEGEPITAHHLTIIVRAWRREAGVDGRSPCHSLRHACATRLVESGARLERVQDLLGHASIVTTREYVARASQKELAEMVEELRVRR